MRVENSGAIELITAMVESLPSGKVESIKISKNGKAVVKFNYKIELVHIENKSTFNFGSL